MPGTHQATITAKTGPNVQNTAMVVPAVRRVEFDLDVPVLRLQVTTGVGDNIREYDLTGVTVVTCTIAAGNYSFVVS